MTVRLAKVRETVTYFSVVDEGEEVDDPGETRSSAEKTAGSADRHAETSLIQR